MSKFIFTVLVYYFALVAAAGLVITATILFHLFTHFVRSRILRMIPYVSSGMPEATSG